MTRVFPINEWAPAQEAQASDPSSSSLSNVLESGRSAPTYHRRTRLMSLPLVDLSNRVSNLAVSEEQDEHTEGKREGTIRSFIRRASVSIKNRQRRHSHATEGQLPSSPWRKLREATSFSRSTRLPHPFDPEGPVDSHELISPIPGYGLAPPIIPYGSGGAARATAAAQNEFLNKNRQYLLADDLLQNDRESGIGIALTTTTESIQSQDTSISTVDFIGGLPAELSMQILAFLDHRSLANVGLVSHKWAQVCNSQHVWREAFLREKSKTYATSKPVAPGKGLGIPALIPGTDWKDIYRIRQELERKWNTGKAEQTYLVGHLDSIYCVQFDEFKIITGSRDKTIRIWDMKTYTCSLIIGPPDIVNNVSIMTGTDGNPQNYATGSDHVRRIECVPRTASFPLHHNASILCLQYDKNILVTGSSDSTCIVHDIKNDYEPIMQLRHHTAAVLDLAFDDRYIVTCSKDNSICIWDRQTGEMLKQLRGHSGPVNAVQLRGDTIVSCSGDFRVKLWNIHTGKTIREFPGHTKGLACSQFSEDSKYIASAGNDKTIRIWDANTGECLQRIAAHENLVRSLHIDSISGRLISASYDQDVKVFDMESGRLLVDFPKWHESWVLGAKSDYRRIISVGQDPKILISDFGLHVKGIEKLESMS